MGGSKEKGPIEEPRDNEANERAAANHAATNIQTRYLSDGTTLPPPQPCTTYPSPHPSTTAYPQQVTVIMGQPKPHKSVFEAYILWFPLGLLGFHHFYLRRYGFGIFYFFTVGGCGIGWLMDLFRMPYLVREANEELDNLDKFKPLRLDDAYIMWFPLGIIGMHHYYLRRPVWGVAYTFTAGFLGIGWIVDAFRMPSLLKKSNEELRTKYINKTPKIYSLCDAYVLGATPLGIFGAHHFYMKNIPFGLFYLFTLGGAGIGWIVDMFRMKWLVERANNPDKFLLGKRHKHLDDAYVLAFPLGILGFHHLYLERPVWGILYFFTLGLAGIGWLVDLFRMPCLVAETNKRLTDELQVVAEVQHHMRGPVQCTVRERQLNVYPPPQGTAESNETPILQPPPYSAVPNNYNSMSHTYPPAQYIPYENPTPQVPASSYTGSEIDKPPAYSNDAYKPDGTNM